MTTEIETETEAARSQQDGEVRSMVDDQGRETPGQRNPTSKDWSG